MPVLTVNQVTVWGALRLLGRRPVGAYQALVDPAAREQLAAPRTGEPLAP
jgi:maleate isomerase